MLAEERAVRCEKQHGAVQRAAATFNHADHEINAVPAGNARERIDRRPGHFHAAVPVAPEVFAALVGPRADHRTEVEAARVGGHEGFGKDGQRGAAGGGVGGQRLGFRERALAIEDDGGGLHDRGCEGGHCRILSRSI